MGEQELLQAGINAARSGNREEAYQLLARLVQAHPNSHEGWYWLGLCLNDRQKQEYCFRRVLAINPNHAEARYELDSISAPGKIQPFSSFEYGGSNSQQAQEVPSPFVAEPEPQINEPQTEPAPVPSLPVESEPPKVRKPVKKKFPWLAVAILVFSCCILVGAGIAFGPTVLGSLIPAEMTVLPPAAAPHPSATSIPSPTPDLSYAPTFEPSNCKIEIPEGVRVDCGYVVVPEDRSMSVTDTIRIAVAIYRSTGPTPAPDPVIFIQGGPGASGLDWAEGSYQDMIGLLSQDRDFIAFDPRGVGESIPALECRELAITYAQELQGKIPADQRAAYYQGALQTCRAALSDQGANLAAYHSEASARDVVDIITALGYEQANIYGVSYGTRVAQIILEQYPEKVRSAILDSIVPLEANLADENSANDMHALQVLFSACAADPACAAAYPNLESTYLDTAAKLDAAPITLEVLTPEQTTIPRKVDGATFKNMVQWSLWMSSLVPFTPQLIDNTSRGDYSFLQFVLAVPAYTYDGISLGTYITVNCREQVLSSALREMDKTLFEMCQQWLGESSPVIEINEPLVSDIPALILAGKFDPVTPPPYASQLSARMSRSFFYEFPALGHAPSGSDATGCAPKLMSAFLRDPAIKPEDACIAAGGPVKFSIPYTGNPPAVLEETMLASFNLVTLVPSDWTDIGFGFYNRGSVPPDVTQLGIQQGPAKEAEWITWLSTEFNGKDGFDGQPIPNGAHRANGLTWNLYEATSKGYPVDMAFAKSGNQTMMVLIESFPDERDANRDTIFLPVIEGTESTE